MAKDIDLIDRIDAEASRRGAVWFLALWCVGLLIALALSVSIADLFRWPLLTALLVSTAIYWKTRQSLQRKKGVMRNDQHIPHKQPDWSVRAGVSVVLAGLLFVLITGVSVWDWVFTILGVAAICGLSVKLYFICKAWKNR